MKRVIYTSSGVAIFSPRAKGFYDERSFNEESIAEVREKGRNAGQYDKYFASKAIAEKGDLVMSLIKEILLTSNIPSRVEFRL